MEGFIVPSKTNLLFITLIVPFFFLAKCVTSQFHFVYEFCLDDVGNYTQNSVYQLNLDTLLSDLQTKSSSSYFDTSMVGQGNDQAYGIYMCRGDLSAQQCHGCVEEASLTIKTFCPVQKEAIIWYEECMVRYANRNIFSLAENSPWAWSRSLGNATDPETFGPLVSETFDGLIAQAAHNESMNGYATGQVDVNDLETVYCHVQCTPDILGDPCEKCLNIALKDTELCCGTARLYKMVFLPSCWLRYDHVPFIMRDGSAPAIDSPSLSPPPSSLPPTMPPLAN